MAMGKQVAPPKDAYSQTPTQGKEDLVLPLEVTEELKKLNSVMIEKDALIEELLKENTALRNKMSALESSLALHKQEEPTAVLGDHAHSSVFSDDLTLVGGNFDVSLSGELPQLEDTTVATPPESYPEPPSPVRSNDSMSSPRLISPNESAFSPDSACDSRSESGNPGNLFRVLLPGSRCHIFTGSARAMRSVRLVVPPLEDAEKGPPFDASSEFSSDEDDSSD
ncbi:hypothetical protein PHLCEN_2v1163 [Hermanssonia centrifuga]|uniref:Uncharacterized protein n=1 Tax=Hermanssonia centrifuga TaxID=98765 RepID=A0A2R6S3T1_9APHY|nr:hypothetical protein PHLCEN_2v1163 [Hermanssonia centrifuga]